ncbi:MAG: M67 family metallopeptidase [Candidatus Omnitrophica bacterium]|nr:M67 family metallopeptidase [Candidatus Omnitrophota bacterium]
MKIKKEILDFIKEHGNKELPNEACGYLAGVNDEILTAVKMTNIDKSPEHFSFDIKEQFNVVKNLREKGLEIKGVYHTHPSSPARMSDEDIRLANDINLFYLIYSLIYDNFAVFKITKEKFVIPVEIEVI